MQKTTCLILTVRRSIFKAAFLCAYTVIVSIVYIHFIRDALCMLFQIGCEISKYAIKTVQFLLKSPFILYMSNVLKMCAQIYTAEISRFYLGHFVFHDLWKNRGFRLSAMTIVWSHLYYAVAQSHRSWHRLFEIISLVANAYLERIVILT